MIDTRSAFDFVHGGRTYTCRIEADGRDRPDPWWWFDVSGDRSRYAPFRATDGDTEVSVQGRMVAYYEDLVARRGGADRRGLAAPPSRG